MERRKPRFPPEVRLKMFFIDFTNQFLPIIAVCCFFTAETQYGQNMALIGLAAAIVFTWSILPQIGLNLIFGGGSKKPRK